jgi:hypothetical protein
LPSHQLWFEKMKKLIDGVKKMKKHHPKMIILKI